MAAILGIRSLGLFLSMFVLVLMDVKAVMANKRGFFFDYVNEHLTIPMLRLGCHAGPPSADVMSIVIHNLTSSTRDRLAWIVRGKGASTGSLSKEKSFYVAGKTDGSGIHPVTLYVLLLDSHAYLDQKFGCTITVIDQNVQYENTNWTIHINQSVTSTTESTTTAANSLTDVPYKVGAVKDKEGDDTDSLPMTVLIVMLVLISILLFLAVFLLLHRYRSRCNRREEELYRPPAYCLAPEHLDWGDNASTLKSKGSARTLNSRSHYSIAAHHMHHMPLPPIPPIPPHSSGLPRRTSRSTGSTTYSLKRLKAGTANPYRRPPSVGSSVKVPYVQPQDAIGQESSEDGEITQLNSSGSPITTHYKSPRDRTRQNSPLYACVPVSSTDD